MDGSQELARLAELLRLGADAERHIAQLRPLDSADLHRLACQTEAIADALDSLVVAPRSGGLH